MSQWKARRVTRLAPLDRRTEETDHSFTRGMSRFTRSLGTLLVAVGVGTLVWTFAVWRWEDPFTGLYTAYQQHRLADRYEQRAAGFKPAARTGRVSLASLRRELGVEARGYRLRSKRGDPIGRIKVARLGLDMTLVNGTDRDTLMKGPARDRRTFMPGEGQLVYIAGHRTTYAAPSSHIDALRPGDRVTLDLPYATFVYRITGHVIVPADDIGRLRSRGYEQLALQACHPRFFATHRYIAYAKPLRVIPRFGHALSPATEARLATAP